MTQLKAGRKPKDPKEKRVQVIFYVTQMYAEEFRNKVQPIAERINKRKTSQIK